MRIVLLFLVVLIFIMLRLPFALKGDETLAGRLQTFLSYSLGAVSLLLSLATVFLSCATLTNELRRNTLHLVVTKPVTRFQVLAGKWLGIVLLNVLLVSLCGAAIYGFASFIKNRPEEFSRDRTVVRDVVWTARSRALPVRPDLQSQAEADIQERIRHGMAPEGQALAVAQRVQELDTQWRTVERGVAEKFVFENLTPPERPDTAVQVRFKARAIPLPPSEELQIGWMFVNPDNDAPLMPMPMWTTERSGEVHQFLAAAEPVIRNGRAALVVINPSDRVNIYFEGDESLEILYKVGSFEANYLKTLALLILRLSFLGALGVFFGTFVSFPVACLCVFTTYVIGLGWPWWWESIGGNIELWSPQIDPYGNWGPLIRPVLGGILRIFPDFTRYSGTQQLIDGEFITGVLLGQCAAHTALFGGVLLLVIGWAIFRRREVAAVTL